MSSNLQSALEFLQAVNYTSLAIITAVIYDYLLTFSKEVEYVWVRRYQLPTQALDSGFHNVCCAHNATMLKSWWLLYVLRGTTFMPGPVKFHRCTAIILAIGWEYSIFHAVADLVMILRVYAMWNESKRILYILLVLYVPQVMVSFIFTGIFDNPNKYLSSITVQVGNFSYCYASSSSNTQSQRFASHMIDSSLQFVLSVTLLILAGFQTLKQSVEIYRVTKQWKLNQYLKQLMEDGIVYFLVTKQYFKFINLRNETLMMPRFIISIRVLYDRRRQGIDTGFGVLSRPVATENAVVSAIAFADVNPGQGESQDDVEDPEAIRLEVLGGGEHQV
ncbi:hypothetical protein OG21DRAFT_1527454 [Imleria badia]|nr:hypothetical protein OG21DRAFT_1527454 [Imleria badia]